MYLCLGNGREPEYVLVMKDDLSCYSGLLANENAYSEAVLNWLSKWITAFGKMVWIVKDRKAYFTASITECLTQHAEKIII